MIPNIDIDVVQHKLAGLERKLLYLVVSGSHSWGLDTPDSDIDLRGIYQDKTANVLSIHKPKDTVEFTESKYDVQLYEVEKFFRMLLKHNGNMVHLLWLPQCYEDNSGIAWGDLAKKFLTRQLARYYKGYAASQRKRALSQRGGKALIYTYREMFSGLYVLRFGTVIFDFLWLWNVAKAEGWYSKGMLDTYWENPKHETTDEEWSKFYLEWERLSQVMGEVIKNSPLPETYDGYALCNNMLLELRKR